MSQESQILSHLKRGPITPLQALKLYGCFRLAARIYDLRFKGHEIDARTIEVNGKQVAQYRLKRR